MKALALLIVCLYLPGCVGLSALGAKEGVYLSANENIQVAKRKVASSSYIDSFGGNIAITKDRLKDRLHIDIKDNGDLFTVRTNCYEESIYSFSPSVVIPFPPIIPLFGMGGGIKRLEITIDAFPKDSYQVKSLNIGGSTHTPINIENYSYKFDLLCKKIPSGSSITIINESGEGEVEINIDYLKSLLFGWGWLGA